MDRKAQNLHITVTSRPELDIKEVLGALDPDFIDVGEATENQDIMKYLKLQMESGFKKYNENIRKEIELSWSRCRGIVGLSPIYIQL